MATLTPHTVEYSASPSGVSSHATHTSQTGRPSMWTRSSERKLARLYLYTILPIAECVRTIYRSPAGAAPGKDSATKKLHASLGKEFRWTHPRSRTDMERRVDALVASPIRTARPEFPVPMSAAVKSSPASPDAPHKPPLPAPSVDECRTGAGAALAQHDPNIAAYILSLPPSDVDHGGCQYAALSPGGQDNLAKETDHPMEDADAPQPPPTRLHRLNTFLRRGTVMSTSTDMTTASLRKALSGKSSGFITQVKRVLRSTMPLHSHGTYPIAEVYPEADCPMRDSWIHDEHAPDEISCAPPLPGEFLIVDRILEQRAPCPGGLDYEHQTKNCLCRPMEAAGASIWVSGTGLSERGARLMQPGTARFANFSEVDVFGNSPMHLVAARDADHMYMLWSVDQGVPCRARNTAGQTFLHLLDPTWLSDDGAPLVTLLRRFQGDPGFLLARDCYGRTLFHVLRSKIDDPAPLSRVLRALDVKLSRDAFGVVPSFEVETPAQPLRRALTSITSGDAAHEADLLPRYESDLRTQECLLYFVSQCHTDPALEDADGRNGLHALAAAILSDTSVYLKAHRGPQSSRKRKHEAPGCEKKLDSSSERLQFREQLLEGLLDAKVDPNAYDGDGNTPLMAFCAQLPDDDDYKVPVSILQLLLDRGADIHARNRRGETALHVAVRRGRKLAVRTLVKAGANVHVRDASGRSVLDVCDEGMAMGEEEEGEYMRLEACRAWLSGQGGAVQDPGVLAEWAAGEE